MPRQSRRSDRTGSLPALDGFVRSNVERFRFASGSDRTDGSETAKKALRFWCECMRGRSQKGAERILNGDRYLFGNERAPVPVRFVLRHIVLKEEKASFLILATWNLAPGRATDFTSGAGRPAYPA
jgi:hypothetical protein